jgi:hypothetical protein
VKEFVAVDSTVEIPVAVCPLASGFCPETGAPFDTSARPPQFALVKVATGHAIVKPVAEAGPRFCSEMERAATFPPSDVGARVPWTLTLSVEPCVEILMKPVNTLKIRTTPMTAIRKRSSNVRTRVKPFLDCKNT